MEQVKTTARKIFQASKGQAKFLRSTKKFRLACTGVGGGKSAVGAIEALRMACLNPGKEAFVCSPTYDMLRLNTVPPIKEFWPDGVIKNTNALNTRSGPFSIELFNGSTIHFRSADNADNLRGPNLAWAWLDEAGQYARYAWNIILGRIRVRCPRPGIFCTTTPKGLTWLWDTFIDAPPSDDYEVITWNARENEHNLDDGFYDRLTKDYSPLLAAQEIEGRFVNIHAEAYLSDASVTRNEDAHLPKMPVDSVPLHVGVDVGRRHDLTVFWGMYKEDGVYKTAFVRTMKDTPFPIQEKFADEIMGRTSRMCIDATGLGISLAESLVTKYGDKVEPVVFGPKNKAELASNLRKLFETDQIRIPKNKDIRNDLLSVENVVTPSGNVAIKASRNDDGHADRFWSLALACRAIGVGLSKHLCFFA